MKTLLCNKVRVARESLKLSQSAASRESNYNQSTISLLEAGENTGIATIYLQFLASKGINLTAMFDDNTTLEDFTSICYGEKQALLSAHVVTAGPCPNCATKDATIYNLGMIIDSQKDTITIMKELALSLKGENSREENRALAG